MPARGKPIFFTDEDEHPVELRDVTTRGNRKRWPPAQRCEAMRVPRYPSDHREGRCKRFATRGGRSCEMHHPDPVTYKAVMRAEVAKMTDARELILEATIVEIAQIPDVSPAVRVKASDLLIRHSGASLERPNENSVTVTINTGAEATRIIAERLDRLAHGQTDVGTHAVRGELERPA